MVLGARFLQLENGPPVVPYLELAQWGPAITWPKAERATSKIRAAIDRRAKMATMKMQPPKV